MASDDSYQIAERYTRALFELAATENVLDAVEKDLLAVKGMLEGAAGKELMSLFNNPLLPRTNKAAVMDALLAKVKGHEITRRFMRNLADNQRLPALPRVIAQFEQKMAEHRGEAIAEVISAAPLTDAQLKTVAASLAKALNRGVRVKTVVDESLIGGIAVKVGGTLVDYSIKNQLSRLGRVLKSGKMAA